jgi:hypothetical protein
LQTPPYEHGLTYFRENLTHFWENIDEQSGQPEIHDLSLIAVSRQRPDTFKGAENA